MNTQGLNQNREGSMSRHRIIANASPCLAQPDVTHSRRRNSPDGVLVCAGCGKQFRLRRPWQKHCSPRCRRLLRGLSDGETIFLGFLVVSKVEELCSHTREDSR